MAWKSFACVALSFVCGVTALSVTPVYADDTGLAQTLHTIRREGGKLCQAEHFHTGNSSGQANKKIAMREAITSWQSFTALEYGTDWANFRRAGSKSAECSKSGSGWSCEVQARPCK